MLQVVQYNVLALTTTSFPFCSVSVRNSASPETSCTMSSSLSLLFAAQVVRSQKTPRQVVNRGSRSTLYSISICSMEIGESITPLNSSGNLAAAHSSVFLPAVNQTKHIVRAFVESSRSFTPGRKGGETESSCKVFSWAFPHRQAWRADILQPAVEERLLLSV